jgi:hypothetical protein
VLVQRKGDVGLMSQARAFQDDFRAKFGHRVILPGFTNTIFNKVNYINT